MTKNLKGLKEELGDTLLVAVSKNQSLQKIIELYNQGQRDFGENKIQEIFGKAQALPNDIRWHMIGQVQRNKLSKLLSIPNLVAIHSVDRLALLEELIKSQVNCDLYLQVNTSGEKEKSGFKNFEQLEGAYQLSHKNVCIKGLMTIGAIRSEDFERDANLCFSKLKKMRDKLNPKLKLSMGMSQDYKIALKHGSTCVRIGSALF